MKVRWYVASFNQWLISVIVCTVSFCLSCSGRGGSGDAEGSPPCRTGPALQPGAVLGTRFGKHVAHWLWMCVSFMSRLAMDVSASCPVWLWMCVSFMSRLAAHEHWTTPALVPGKLDITPAVVVCGYTLHKTVSVYHNCQNWMCQN